MNKPTAIYYTSLTALGIAGCIVGSVFHATTAIVLSAILASIGILATLP